MTGGYATVFDVKHFAVHDGPGIRTTVFFKGCPLRCAWCHNPEGFSTRTQIAFLRENCVGCRRCEAVCARGVHVFGKSHEMRAENCDFCGRCEKICPREALTLYGREVSVDALMPELLEDRDFYGRDGGVTLSGGECLTQADFCASLLERLKREGVHTAVDTCGSVPREAFEAVLPFTDLFLYDVKAFDEDVHVLCTGVSNRLILDNLVYLDEKGAPVEIRVPFVPGFNAGEIGKIAAFLAALKTVRRVKLLPCHTFGISKYASLGMTVPLLRAPAADEVEEAVRVLREAGLTVV